MRLRVLNRLDCRLVGLLAVVVCELALGGCKGRSAVTLHPVRGQVFYKDQPADGAQIVFQPPSGATKEQPIAYGTVAADGSFVLRTEFGEGAVAGEIALYQPSNRGTLIVGDALINFEPHGFTFLPRKYCQNEKQMRHSLRQLVSRPAERILFAHGTPILSGATARLQQLLESQ